MENSKFLTEHSETDFEKAVLFVKADEKSGSKSSGSSVTYQEKAILIPNRAFRQQILICFGESGCDGGH